MTKQPLVMVEFTKDLDDMTDDELDELAGVIAEAMADQLPKMVPDDTLTW